MFDQDAEDRYESAARILMGRNPFFVDYIRTKKNGSLDADKKIDAVLTTLNSVAVLLQIKNIPEKIVEHYEVRGCVHILAITPPSPISTDEELSYQLEKEALDALNNPDETPYQRFLKKQRAPAT